jgi:hypothetical protein
MTQQSSESAAKATIAEYIEACRVGNASRLKSIFHPNALMAGYYEGEYYMGSPEPFFDEVRDNPPPIESGVEYLGDILTVEVFGDIASITLMETGYLNTNFTNCFHLAKLDGEWKIICKSYQDG